MEAIAILIVGIFVYGLVCGAYCSHVAIAKNLNGMKWGIGGFFFGIIALIALAGMPQKKPY